MDNKKGKTSNYAIKWKKVMAYIKHPSSIIAFILLSTPLRWILSDRTYIKLRYSLNFKKTLNLDYPQTYTEKLQWKPPLVFYHGTFGRKSCDALFYKKNY